MKKIVVFIVMILCALMTSISLAADVKVQINGEIVDFTDGNGDKVEAQTINSRTMVPLRKIFEILGCKIDWNGTTKEIKATKDDRIIEMQIDNKDVSFTINNVKENKTLDQAPIIKDNRTLVPLRFISEALDMQVGWDGSNSTAIIIDYESFVEVLSEKSSFIWLYDNTDYITLTKNYYDDHDSSRNCSTTFSIEKVYDENPDAPHAIVNVSITGNSEFAKEVEKEEWNSFKYNIYADDYYETSNYVFSKMICLNKNEKGKVLFSRFNLSSDSTKEFADYLKVISSVEDSKINVDTYKTLKEDWTKFANTFFDAKSKKLKAEDFDFNQIDLNKIFTQRTKSDSITALQLFNQLLFKISDDHYAFFADFPDVEYSYSDAGNEGIFKFYLKNEYLEREEYIIKFYIQNMA